jgi:hypothetical protein
VIRAWTGDIAFPAVFPGVISANQRNNLFNFSQPNF